MTVSREYETPAPPPLLKQVAVTNPNANPIRRGLVQRTFDSNVYIAMEGGLWPPDEARAVAEAILEILDGPSKETG